jgi:hypothetical protein
MLKKEIKGMLAKRETHHIHVLQDNVELILILPKWMHRFNVISDKMPEEFFVSRKVF